MYSQYIHCTGPSSEYTSSGIQYFAVYRSLYRVHQLWYTVLYTIQVPVQSILTQLYSTIVYRTLYRVQQPKVYSTIQCTGPSSDYTSSGIQYCTVYRSLYRVHQLRYTVLYSVHCTGPSTEYTSSGIQYYTLYRSLYRVY